MALHNKSTSQILKDLAGILAAFFGVHHLLFSSFSKNLLDFLLAGSHDYLGLVPSKLKEGSLGFDRRMLFTTRPACVGMSSDGCFACSSIGLSPPAFIVTGPRITEVSLFI
jgi:hypothetical protein